MDLTCEDIANLLGCGNEYDLCLLCARHTTFFGVVDYPNAIKCLGTMKICSRCWEGYVDFRFLLRRAMDCKESENLLGIIHDCHVLLLWLGLEKSGWGTLWGYRNRLPKKIKQLAATAYQLSHDKPINQHGAVMLGLYPFHE